LIIAQAKLKIKTKKGGRGPGCICVRWWWNLTLPGARPPALGASSVIAQRDPCYRLEIEAVMIGDADALSLLSAGRHVDK